MAELEQKKKTHGGLRGLIVSAVSLCVIAVLALLLIPGGPGPGIDGIIRWLTGTGEGELEGEYHFSQGVSRLYADLGGAVAAIGELGIQALGADGKELYHEQVRLSDPAVSAAGGRAVVYDKGGKALRVINSGGVLARLDSDMPIVSASMNESGWYCVCTQSGGVFKNVVTVYTSKGDPAYAVEIGSGYVLDARLDGDNMNLAILTVTDTGGSVRFYRRDSEDEQGSFNRDDEVILALAWMPDGRVLAVTDTAVLRIGKDGSGEPVYDFSGRYLGGLCLASGDFVTLYLLDYGVGNVGRLVTLGADGGFIAELLTTGENKAMSASGGTLATLWDSHIALYDAKLSETRIDPDGGAYSDILAVSGGKVLAIGPRAARVIN